MQGEVETADQHEKDGNSLNFRTFKKCKVAIITVPIFTRLMTTEQIGVVNIYNSWYSLISAFATLSLTSGGFAVAMKDYSNKRDEYESSILTLTSIVAVAIALIYIIAPGFWQKVIGLSNSLIVLMLIGFLVAPARDFWEREGSRIRILLNRTLGGGLSGHFKRT